MADKNTVISWLEGLTQDDWQKWYSDSEVQETAKAAFALLKERETVVRCKDCKWYQEGIDIDGKPFTRCNGNVRVYGHTKPNWFCADGERRLSMVTEREKVLKGLETCYCPPSKCEDCPYNDIENCNDTLCLDAIALLKQEKE